MQDWLWLSCFHNCFTWVIIFPHRILYLDSLRIFNHRFRINQPLSIRGWKLGGFLFSSDRLGMFHLILTLVILFHPFLFLWVPLIHIQFLRVIEKISVRFFYQSLINLLRRLVVWLTHRLWVAHSWGFSWVVIRGFSSLDLKRLIRMLILNRWRVFLGARWLLFPISVVFKLLLVVAYQSWLTELITLKFFSVPTLFRLTLGDLLLRVSLLG